jgi:hypothetical protein
MAVRLARHPVLWRLDGAIRNFDVSADVALVPLERTIPIRRFFAWPGKRNSGWAIGKFPHSPLEVVGRGRAWLLAWELGSVVSC